MRGPLGAVIGRYPSSDGSVPIDGGIIRHNRKCRDIAFLVIFIAFWVAMIVNSSFGFNQGNPLRLTYGLDYKGNVCGDRHADPGLQGEIRLNMDDWIDRNYDYFEFLTPAMRNSSLQLQGPCYPVLFPSVNVYWSCQYLARVSNLSLKHWQQMGGVNINEDIIIDKSIHKTVNSRSSVLKRYMADIGKSWPVLIVCGGLLPLFLSVIWLLMIRHFVAAMPWITVSLFNILIISVTMFYYLKAGWIGNDAISPIIGVHDPYYHVSARELNHIRAVAVLMTFIMVVAILTSIAIVRRILMATSVLKASDRVREQGNGDSPPWHLVAMPAFLCYVLLDLIPRHPTLMQFHSGQVVQNKCNSNCCAYDLVSKSVNCDRCCGYSIHYTPHIAIAIFFHLFGCYWATQFFIASSSTVIAGSVASYYWARGETSPEIPFLPVFSSMKRLLRYSLGSVALGSLIVSFVESIRFILESIRRKMKIGGTTPDSWYGKAAFYSSRGCLRGIEWTIKSVNRNAYIMIAITGKSFCRASAIATELIMNNILRIGRVNVIGDVILFLGKLCVSLSSAVFAFLMLDTHKYRSAHNKISSPLFPVLVCWGLGYVVATLFFGVVEMSIDTIILSFCQDSEEHQGTAQYAPPLLIETLNDQNEMQRLTQ
ncbi:hypothetical protein Patl1_04616 [Pistacia atlantica]|uniref:Uncharacterized protein n=1 Tax=Pistacia atlantica TaxID=434234 RepID=A0ACC1BVJ4_9ROSI|nr:hypothetical protein Patl1_04616 [Pistacia atlantica]